MNAKHKMTLIAVLCSAVLCSGLLCACEDEMAAAVTAPESGAVSETELPDEAPKEIDTSEGIDNAEENDAADETGKKTVEETIKENIEKTAEETITETAEKETSSGSGEIVENTFVKENASDDAENEAENDPENDAEKDTENDDRPVFEDRANATEGIGNPKELNEGDVAPDFTVTLANGEKLTLSDYDDRIVLLNFWATWCPPCVGEMPAFERLYQEMGDEVLILGIDYAESKGEVDSFIKKYGYTYPIGYDEKNIIGDYYPTDGIPYTLVIDHGIIAQIFIGAYDADAMYLEYSSAIDALR